MKNEEYRKRRNQRGYEIRRIIRAEKRSDVKHFTHRWDDDDVPESEQPEEAV
jgi:hypothetical protein